MGRIRVLIADDHPIVRQGLRQLLESEPDLQVIGEAGDGMETLAKTRELHPHVLLLDIAMPRMSGLEMAQMVRSVSPQTQIVILSMYEKETFAHKALEAGALGYVLKGGPGEDILSAIRAAHEGRYFLSPSISSTVMETYLKSSRKDVEDEGYRSLSDRERQIFLLLVEGNTTAQIGETLFISPKTVEKHRANILEKVGVKNAVELVKYAIRIGVVDAEIWKF